MNQEENLDILMIGHMAKDRLVVDGRGEMAAGGGVYYGSMALRRLDVSVGVVTRLHPDDFDLLADMKQAGVRVWAVPAPATSGIENIYFSADMERRICRLLGFAGAFALEDIPDVPARIQVVASIIAGEVHLPLLRALAARGPVAIDIQGFVRVREAAELVFRPWPEIDEGLKYVTYLKVDRAEAELLTGHTEFWKAAERLAEYGPREIVLTQSSGVTVLADGEFHSAPFTPRSLAGRTGRGDTCFATYLGKRLSLPAEEATRWAAAVTTLKQEEPGPWRGSAEDVQRVWQSWS